MNDNFTAIMEIVRGNELRLYMESIESTPTTESLLPTTTTTTISAGNVDSRMDINGESNFLPIVRDTALLFFKCYFPNSKTLR